MPKLNVADGKKFTRDIFYGEHGDALILEDDEAVNAVMRATRSISFQIGKWTRTLPANPLLGGFGATCKRFRERYPNR